jgi:hypothetical protein
MEIVFIVFIISTVIFALLYANLPFMQSEEFKQIDDEEEIWERWS